MDDKLRKASITELQLVKIGTVSDLMKAKPIVSMNKVYGKDKVLDTAMAAITKCFMAIGQEIDPNMIRLIASDLVVKYRYDSLEDIIECLRKGRNGLYGKVYGKVNSLVINEWMQKHLEEKYAAKESQIQQQKEEEPGEVRPPKWNQLFSPKKLRQDSDL